MKTAVELQQYAWQGAYARMRSAHHADHDSGLCCTVDAPWMGAGEQLIIRSSEIVGYPEAYLYDDHLPPAEPDGRGKSYHHTPFRWDSAGAPARLYADCPIEGQGRFSLELQAQEDFVDIRLSLRNDLASSMGPIDWHFCVIGFECPSLANPELERTFLFDGQQLRTLRSMTGSNRTDMYIIAGTDDFIPEVHLPFATGPVEAQASVVIVQDCSGSYCAALGFDHAYNIFSNHGNRCFHADPYFATVAPGEEVWRHGRLYLMQGTAEDAFQRYRNDFTTQI